MCLLRDYYNLVEFLDSDERRAQYVDRVRAEKQTFEQFNGYAPSPIELQKAMAIAVGYRADFLEHLRDQKVPLDNPQRFEDLRLTLAGMVVARYLCEPEQSQ